MENLLRSVDVTRLTSVASSVAGGAQPPILDQGSNVTALVDTNTGPVGPGGLVTEANSGGGGAKNLMYVLDGGGQATAVLLGGSATSGDPAAAVSGNRVIASSIPAVADNGMAGESIISGLGAADILQQALQEVTDNESVVSGTTDSMVTQSSGGYNAVVNDTTSFDATLNKLLAEQQERQHQLRQSPTAVQSLVPAGNPHHILAELVAAAEALDHPVAAAGGSGGEQRVIVAPSTTGGGAVAGGIQVVPPPSSTTNVVVTSMPSLPPPPPPTLPPTVSASGPLPPPPPPGGRHPGPPIKSYSDFMRSLAAKYNNNE